MKVQFVYRENGVVVERGYVYEVLSVDNGWYRILDGDGVKAYYPASMFEIVEENPQAPEIHYTEADCGEDGLLAV